MRYLIVFLTTLAVGITFFSDVVSSAVTEDVPDELQYAVESKLGSLVPNAKYEFVALQGTHRQKRQANPTTQNVNSTTTATPITTAASISSTTPAPLVNGTAVTNGTSSTTPAAVDKKQSKNETHTPVPSPDLTVPDELMGYPDLNSSFWFDGWNKNYILKDQNDTHEYYNTSIIINGSAWKIDVDQESTSEEHKLLSSAYRRAVAMKLKFKFPFYGHLIDNVTVATGGFLYLGEQVHAWLAATQYVAPLMANFDPSLSENSTVICVNAKNHFTVEWRDVHLRKGENGKDHQKFTFQVTLHSNGTIVFYYTLVPVPFKEIADEWHPVKVGLSDAYIREQRVLFYQKKTIYEYNRLDMKDKQVTNGTAIVFYALPTCLDFKTCETCTNHNSTFACAWCAKENRCSDGLDRLRNDWISNECEKNAFNASDKCIESKKNNYTTDTSPHPFNHNEIDEHATETSASKQSADAGHGMSAGGVLSVLFFIVLIVGAVGWVLYAYNFPHTTSGQMLIRYRPSQWGFRRGEARYTAASIHM